MSKLVVGVCAMDIKARSRTMRNILDKLLSFGEFEVVLFGDHVILEEPVEHWPICDILLAFFSRGFPLAKAVDYAKLRNPFCVNDLLLQYLLLDRRLVLLILDAIDVPTPYRLIANRDDCPLLSAEAIELVSRDFNINLSNPSMFSKHPMQMLDDDTIQIGGRILRKPFLEKPANAEDHNINIYYPGSMGGGCRTLFRKVANKSSEFVADLVQVRTDRSYIYEEFLEAENAEDVKVYTVGLHYAHAESRKAPVVDGIVRRNAYGKEIRVVTEMSCEEQEIARRVCMAFGQTICGFDVLRAKGRSFVVDVNGWSFVKGNEKYLNTCALILRDTFLRATVPKRHSWKYEPFLSNTEGQWRLKCYVCVVRHGDRTPKQKMKLTVKHLAYQELLPVEYSGENILIRDKILLLRALEITTMVLSTVPPNDEDYPRLRQLADVLEKKVNIPGTKLQLRKITRGATPSMLLIVKWGGDYTHAGRHHTKDLGENMRKELIILNKSILDDVKIFCSAERRVLATAEVFAKAFLAIVEVAPNCISVLKEALDDSFVSKDDVYEVKRRIGTRLQIGPPFDEEDSDDPVYLLRRLKVCLALHREIMRKNLQSLDNDKLPTRWCCSESINLFKERWDKHFIDVLENAADWFDPSKISDLYDSLKFDALHHRRFLETIFTTGDESSKRSLHELYLTAQKLFDFVAPREYGIYPGEILRIGRQISGLLLHQIIQDLKSATTSLTRPIARLYFTKESHVTALLNIIRHCGIPLSAAGPVHEVCGNELDYLSHICFELYERRTTSKGRNQSDPPQVRYSLRIGLSNGAHNPRLLDLQLDARHAISVTPKRWLTDYLEGLGAIGQLARTVGGVESEYSGVGVDRRENRLNL